ncbi:MAG TPA: metal-dependent transcriptional regulator [Luteibaculaceae bacterium]|nr:metal-dependent transcriptional regulator [Luteibaculaceae bacterium]
MPLIAEENCLKAIYALSRNPHLSISTSTLADQLRTKPSSVTELIKRLAHKNWVIHEPYRSISLSEEGKVEALKVIRRHRLWEVFLHRHLGFQWDEVHEIAEQLEHIEHPELVRRLDEYLHYPSTDPHGDPIPSESGEINTNRQDLLSAAEKGKNLIISGFVSTEPDFLRYMDRCKLHPGVSVHILDINSFDGSLTLCREHLESFFITQQTASHIWIRTDEQ